MSYSAADENNMLDAKSKGKISLYLSITGIIVAVVLIAYFVHLSMNTISNLSTVDLLNKYLSNSEIYADTVDSINNALSDSNLYTTILIQ
ncbi:hypothetical protein A3Q56_01181 [Intoshia linei]|uniref:Uncharacterized protein n=1 Tax=Intoshia linei TaxID=1819745 RepID=A0A177BBP1_9BILA|nr:hypothetical protein A3Q56_01181 [Intoshia linei]